MAFLKAVTFWFSSSLVAKRKGKAKVKVPFHSKLGVFVVEEAYLLEDPNHICSFNTEGLLLVNNHD